MKSDTVITAFSCNKLIVTFPFPISTVPQAEPLLQKYFPGIEVNDMLFSMAEYRKSVNAITAAQLAIARA